MSQTPADPSLQPVADAPVDPDAWHRPPVRAVRLHAGAMGALFSMVAIAGFVFSAPAMRVMGVATWLALGLVGLIVTTALGAYAGARLRHQRWKLDAEGLWLRQGRLWFRETRVPASRVQHVDIKHGPLERRFQLATLVVHTAAVQLSGITVRGLDQADAQRLRDALAQQLDEAGDAL